VTVAIGAIIIGDEILSGKRQDKHFDKVVELLKARGMALDWAHYLGDDRARLTGALRRSLCGRRHRLQLRRHRRDARTTTRARPPPPPWASASPCIPTPSAKSAAVSAKRPRRSA
jgi:hypothetical protein